MALCHSRLIFINQKKESTHMPSSGKKISCNCEWVEKRRCYVISSDFDLKTDCLDRDLCNISHSTKSKSNVNHHYSPYALSLS